MIESVEIKMTLYRIRCDSCKRLRELAFTRKSAIAWAERDGWLWNGEELWCQTCLTKLSEEVP